MAPGMGKPAHAVERHEDQRRLDPPARDASVKLDRERDILYSLFIKLHLAWSSRGSVIRERLIRLRVGLAGTAYAMTGGRFTV